MAGVRVTARALRVSAYDATKARWYPAVLAEKGNEAIQVIAMPVALAGLQLAVDQSRKASEEATEPARFLHRYVVHNLCGVPLRVGMQDGATPKVRPYSLILSHVCCLCSNLIIASVFCRFLAMGKLLGLVHLLALAP